MKLVKFSYKDADWELKDLELDSLNLVVAKNATGKSKSLVAMKYLASMLCQESETIKMFPLLNIKIVAEFVDNDDLIKYQFAFKDGKCVSETFEINNVSYLKRTPSQGTLQNLITGENEEIFPPENRLVINTNRDTKKYSYFERLIDWADIVAFFDFSNIRPSIHEYDQNKFEYTADLDVPTMMGKLNDIARELVRKELNSIGYSIIKISSYENQKKHYYDINEEGCEEPITSFMLSQGLYRSLALLIYIEYIISLRHPTMIVIDDLCEGLDYERARKLGELVFKKCEDSNIQLIATSNDSFLMDVVDIKYWNVLQRKGSVVTALNNKNHPKLFADFAFTGLSNFDFFSSDYINRNVK